MTSLRFGTLWCLCIPRFYRLGGKQGIEPQHKALLPLVASFLSLLHLFNKENSVQTENEMNSTVSRSINVILKPKVTTNVCLDGRIDFEISNFGL